MSTESNNDIGTYQFYVDYALEAPSNTSLKVLQAREFQIEILKRPTFAPYFEKPLDNEFKVTLNEKLSYELPPYVKYDRDDESLDSVVITVTSSNTEKEQKLDILNYDKLKKILYISPQIIVTDEMTEEMLEEIKLSLVGEHQVNIVLTELSTNLTRTYDFKFEVLDRQFVLAKELQL